MLADPNKPPVARQPPVAYWIPSKPKDPWFGTIRGATKNEFGWEGGARFTEEQEAAMIRLNIDIPTAKSMTVKRQANQSEIWTGCGTLPAVFAFECPLVPVKPKANGRIRVITPAGLLAWVLPDGWAHRPYRQTEFDPYLRDRR